MPKRFSKQKNWIIGQKHTYPSWKNGQKYVILPWKNG